MKKAIVIYIDDNVKLIEEFSWLWKTWNMWDLMDEFDIVAYCNPSAVSKLPVHDNLIVKPLESLSDTDPFWANYKFVNSFAMFNDPDEANWIIKNYTHILKTDADVFLTEHIKGLTPSKVLIGYGGYMGHSPEDRKEILGNLQKIRDDLKLQNNGMTNIGASIFAKTPLVVSTVRDHFILTKYILQTQWNKSEGKWPGWFKGVSSMYAIDLVINNNIPTQLISLYTLDTQCWDNLIDSNTYHIHAWHGPDFSKHKWFNGEYDKLESSEIPKVAKDYCLWIASNTLDELNNVINSKK